MSRSIPRTAYKSVRKGYDYEEQARRQLPKVLHSTQLSYERLVTLYEHVAYLERKGVEGAFVECGVWRGGAVGLMALANQDFAKRRRHLHLFDSFEGMPEPRAAQDGQAALDWTGTTGDGRLTSTGANVASPEGVHRLLVDRIGYPNEYVHIHVGWFQDTLPAARESIGQIALLRIDGDWYESTLVVFENLYRQVVAGGIVIVDDYGHFPGCRQATDEFLERNAPGVYLHYVDYAGRYFLKP